MTNIGLQKLLTLYNLYKSENATNVSFEIFLVNNHFFDAKESDFAINNVENLETNDSFSLDGTEFDENKFKLSSFISFIAENELNDDEINGFMNKIVIYMILQKKTLQLSNETAEKVITNYHTYLENPKIEKSHPVASALGKKVALPTFITAAICALVGGAIGWAGTLPGASDLWTANTWGNVLSIGSIGLMAGLVATPATILIKNLSTRNHYAKKYGVKSNNLSLLNDLQFNAAIGVDFENLEEKLPICELLNKIEESRKILAESEINKTKNPFKKLATYNLRKQNRNREHAVVDFYQYLLNNIETCEDEEQKAKFEALKAHIQDHVYACYQANLAVLLQKKLEGKSKDVVRDMDIMTAIILGDDYQPKTYHKNSAKNRKVKKEKIQTMSQDIAYGLLTADNTETLSEDKHMVAKMIEVLKASEVSANVEPLTFSFESKVNKKQKAQEETEKDLETSAPSRKTKKDDKTATEESEAVRSAIKELADDLRTRKWEETESKVAGKYKKYVDKAETLVESICPNNSLEQDKLLDEVYTAYYLLVTEDEKDKKSIKILEDFVKLSKNAIKNRVKHLKNKKDVNEDKQVEEENKKPEVTTSSKNVETKKQHVESAPVEKPAEQTKTEVVETKKEEINKTETEEPAKEKQEKTEPETTDKPSTKTTTKKVVISEMSDEEFVEYVKEQKGMIPEKVLSAELKRNQTGFADRLKDLISKSEDRKTKSFLNYVKSVCYNKFESIKSDGYEGMNEYGDEHHVNPADSVTTPVKEQPTEKTEKKEPEAEQKKVKPKTTIISDLSVDEFITRFTTTKGVSKKVATSLNNSEESTLFTNKLNQLLNESNLSDQQRVLLNAIKSSADSHLEQMKKNAEKLQQGLSQN